MMKAIKFLFVALLSVCSLSVYAGNGNSGPAGEEEVRSFVKDRLSTDYLVEYNPDGLKVKIKFLINEDNEVIVLTTDSSDVDLDAYIKRRLNYETIESDDLNKGKTYILSVEFEEK